VNIKDFFNITFHLNKKRAIKEMSILGAKFNQSVSLNYTRLNLYGEEPQLLGNVSDIYANQTLKQRAFDFYSSFQKQTDYLTQLYDIYTNIVIKKEFFFYYNSLYWFIELKPPFIKVTYDQVPLP
jgi:ceroid-lipofuscinosis neuronal protein 5